VKTDLVITPFVNRAWSGLHSLTELSFIQIGSGVWRNLPEQLIIPRSKALEKSTDIFIRPKDCKFDPSDLPVIANLTALGYNSAEIGMILGYQGANWRISAGKTLGEDAKSAIQIGLDQADALLVKDLIEQATGYEWTEIKKVYKAVPAFDPQTGQDSVKMIPVEEVHTTKRQPGNARLAELLAVNRLPDVFRRVSEIRKTSFEAKAELTDSQIEKLIGKLLEVTDRKKVIEAEVVNRED
jgi:hypothetical protein